MIQSRLPGSGAFGEVDREVEADTSSPSALSSLSTARDRDHCPTCRARRDGRADCRRCGADLSSLLKLERDAEALAERAREEYASGRFRRAAALAERAARLVADEDTWRLAACAHLRSGQFPEALRAMRAVERTTG